MQGVQNSTDYWSWFPWPVSGSPICFAHHEGEEYREGTSLRNRAEAKIVGKVGRGFVAAGVLPCYVGILTPYDAQRSVLQAACKDLIALRLLVDCVDKFQGSERAISVFSMFCFNNSRSSRTSRNHCSDSRTERSGCWQWELSAR